MKTIEELEKQIAMIMAYQALYSAYERMYNMLLEDDHDDEVRVIIRDIKTDLKRLSDYMLDRYFG